MTPDICQSPLNQQIDFFCFFQSTGQYLLFLSYNSADRSQNWTAGGKVALYSRVKAIWPGSSPVLRHKPALFFFFIAFYIICVNLKVYFPTHVGLGPGDGCGFQVVFDNRSDVEVRQMDVTCGKQTVSAQHDKEHPLHVLDGGLKLQDYGAFFCATRYISTTCALLCMRLTWVQGGRKHDQYAAQTCNHNALGVDVPKSHHMQINCS